MSAKPFKSFIIFNMDLPPKMANNVEAAVMERRATNPSGVEWHRTGFIPPCADDVLVQQLHGGAVALALMKSERILPGAVIREATETAVIDTEEKEGRRVSRKERQIIKERVVDELLPKAFIKRTVTRVLICYPYLLIEASSVSRAEDALTVLRQVIDIGRCRHLNPVKAPHEQYTAWVADGSAPHPFTIGAGFRMCQTGAESKVISGSNVDPTDEAIQQLVGQHTVSRLDLTWASEEQSLMMTVDSNLTVSKVKWPSEMFASSGEEEDKAHDAVTTLTLMVGYLKPFITDLLTALGGDRNAVTRDESIESLT